MCSTGPVQKESPKSLTTAPSPSAAPSADPSSAPLRLAVIIGSVREGRFGTAVAHWFAGVARQRADLAVEVIDPVDVPLEMTGPAPRSGDGTARSPAALRPRPAPPTPSSCEALREARGRRPYGG